MGYERLLDILSVPACCAEHKAPQPSCQYDREMEEGKSREEHALLLRNVGDQSFAEGFFLDLTWCMAHIDDEAIDF